MQGEDDRILMRGIFHSDGGNCSGKRNAAQEQVKDLIGSLSRVTPSQPGVRTSRPETLPFLNRSRASLAWARGRAATWQRTLPAAAKARTSRKSCRVPTAVARIRTSPAAI